LPTRERAYVKDVALGVREAIFVERPTTRIYSLGSGQLVSSRDVLHAVERLAPGARVVVDAAEGDPERLVDDAAARRDLDYHPRWSLETALVDLAEELRA